MKKWYNVINEKGADTASVLIYDIIGGGFFEDGTNAKDFANTILQLEKEYKNINIRINSPGGSVFEGLGIVNAIINSKSHIETYIDGIAYSMAAIIALSGKKVHMAKNGRLMLHNASIRAQGNAYDLRTQADNLDGYDSALAITVSEITGLSVSEVKQKYFNYKDNYFNADEAIQNKLVHEIVQTKAEGVDNILKINDYNDVLAYFKNLDPSAFEMPAPIINQNQNNMKFTSLTALAALLEKGNKPTASDIAKAQVELSAENTGLIIVNSEKYNKLINDSESANTSSDLVKNIKALFPNNADEKFDLVAEIKNLQSENQTLKAADGDSPDRGNGGDNSGGDGKNIQVTAESDIQKMLAYAGL